MNEKDLENSAKREKKRERLREFDVLITTFCLSTLDYKFLRSHHLILGYQIKNYMFYTFLGLLAIRSSVVSVCSKKNYKFSILLYII